MLLTPWPLSLSLSTGADVKVKVLFGNWEEEDQTEIVMKQKTLEVGAGLKASAVMKMLCYINSHVTVVSKGEVSCLFLN